MNKEEAKSFLIDISYKLGNMSVEYLTEKDGEKMREAVKALEQEPDPCEDIISRKDVVDILLNEMECVQRASDDECDRDCIKCGLLRDTDKILQAYRMAIKVLEHPEKNVVAIVPCGDAISRQAVLSMQYRIDDSATLSTRDVVNVDDIEDLPSVIPEAKTGRCNSCKWYDEDRIYNPNCENCCRNYKDNYCEAKMVGMPESEDKTE